MWTRKKTDRDEKELEHFRFFFFMVFYHVFVLKGARSSVIFSMHCFPQVHLTQKDKKINYTRKNCSSRKAVQKRGRPRGSSLRKSELVDFMLFVSGANL